MPGMSLKMWETIIIELTNLWIMQWLMENQYLSKLLKIAQEIEEIGEPMTEYFQVSTTIGKLPPSCKDYQKLLKRDRTIKTIEDLFQNMQIDYASRKTIKLMMKKLVK